MNPDGWIAFGPFEFYPRTGELRADDGRETRLTPRATAVLNVLAQRAQSLVSKKELFEEVWRGLAVSDDALTSCIQELRQALGDNARRPLYIETQHRRGYRLMHPATRLAQATHVATRGGADVRSPRTLVGRAAEMVELKARFQMALSGRRQLVFVTGEPGIGKSELVGAFVQQVNGGSVIVGQGQCLDHHGVGEPYLPLIEALTRLGASASGDRVRQIVAAHAPSWLALMPSLWTDEQRRALQARGPATRERMLRELTLALEAIAADMPLVLVLEDIHWSDASTLDWLSHVARRPEPAALIVLATFRPADTTASSNLSGIVAELALHDQCCEIALHPLTLDAVETYLSRLAHDDRPDHTRETAQMLLERTGGNPLFMVSIVNQWRTQSSPATNESMLSIPADVRRFIGRQIDNLADGDRELLAAASVIRREFTTAAVAAAMEIDVAKIEDDCARLARRGAFVVTSGQEAWPDGTVTELYTFRHDLYRELLYGRLAARRRALCHARVGSRLEIAWRGRLDIVAAEIAEHFDRGGEPGRAIVHHQLAARRALRRSANREAILHLQRALNAIEHLADEDERTKVEIELRVAMGAAFIAMRGFGAPEVLESYKRAGTLCDALGERTEVFPALWGQWMFHTGRGETQTSHHLCGRLLTLAEKFDDNALRIQAHHASWSTSFVRGELDSARAHSDSALQLFDPAVHRAMASSYGNHDAACCARNFSAMALALGGDAEGARGMMDHSLAAATSLDDPFSLALTLFFTSAAAQMLGDIQLATKNSNRSLQIAREHDLAQPMAWSMGVNGWCMVRNGDPQRGVELVTQAVAAMHTIQSRHLLCYLIGLLSDAHAAAGNDIEALKAAERGLTLAEASGEQFYNAELHRLRGQVLADQPGAGEVEAEKEFAKAIKVAKEQGAKNLERKAINSMRRRR